MTGATYDTIGEGYNRYRRPDPRLQAAITGLLDLMPGATVTDIGAGTGNYSRALADLGYRVIAVEPSERMRNQARPHESVQWLACSAESIPLADDSVQGVLAVLSIHHFQSLDDALDEMQRICSTGPIVIFTLDPRESDDLWFKEYFADIHAHDYEWFPPIGSLLGPFAEKTRRSLQVIPYPLPHDSVDLFMYSGWNRPDIYLDPQIRTVMSGFALAPPSIVSQGVTRLKDDLESGAWDEKHGHLRTRTEFDAGFRFVKLKP